jgi:hypothetical protein
MSIASLHRVRLATPVWSHDRRDAEPLPLQPAYRAAALAVVGT